MTTGTKEESAVATAALAGNHGFSLISNEKLLQLYASMVKCRMIEERLRLLSDQLTPEDDNRASIIHEAAVVGAAIDLLPEDTVAPSLLDSIIKSLPLSSISSSLFDGTLTPKVAAGLTGQLTSATVVAQRNKMKKDGSIVAVFRDGETASIESWNQALRLADAEQLPMLFVNYSTALAENLDARAGVDESAAWPHGFPSIPVDVNDVVAVYRVATEAIIHARKGNGATSIECVTRHCGDHSEIDSILKMEAYLTRKGLFTEAVKHEVATGLRRELDAVIAAAAAG